MNLADYFTKHHSPSCYHCQKHLLYLQQQFPPIPHPNLQGCVLCPAPRLQLFISWCHNLRHWSEAIGSLLSLGLSHNLTRTIHYNKILSAICTPGYIYSWWPVTTHLFFHTKEHKGDIVIWNYLVVSRRTLVVTFTQPWLFKMSIIAVISFFHLVSTCSQVVFLLCCFWNTDICHLLICARCILQLFFVCIFWAFHT